MIKLMVLSMTALQRFRRDERGLAMTEYLVVLGLLVGGVIGAILFFGEQLEIVWTTWANWLGGLDDNANTNVFTSNGGTVGT